MLNLVIVGDYAGFSPNNSFLTANGSIETKLGFSLLYGPLENKVSMMPALEEEAEDPPETLHTTWGVWLHKRDALHGIDQKYDMEHVLRTIRAADDILHYYHYVPVIGEHEHIHESYEMNFEYNYSNEEAIYGAKGAFDEETSGDSETAIDFDFDEDPNLASQIHDEGLDEKENIPIDNGQKADIDFELEKELAKIFEKALKLIENKGR